MRFVAGSSSTRRSSSAAHTHSSRGHTRLAGCKIGSAGTDKARTGSSRPGKMGTGLLTLSLRVQPPVLPQEVPQQVELLRLLEPLRLGLGLPLPRVELLRQQELLRPVEHQQRELLRQRVLLPQQVEPRLVLLPQQVVLPQLVAPPQPVALRQLGAIRQAEVHLVVDRQQAGLQRQARLRRQAGLRGQGVLRVRVRVPVEGELRQGVPVGEEEGQL